MSMAGLERLFQDLVRFSQASRSLATQRSSLEAQSELTDEQALELNVIKALLERLLGSEVHLVDPSEFMARLQGHGGEETAQQQVQTGLTLEYEFSQQLYESEQSTFQAGGVIRTSDGQEVEFELNLGMSRQFLLEQQGRLRIGPPLKDPLVVNFAAPSTQLTRTKFEFDIDSDGTPDQISFTGPGSGFLALDLNGDGQIGDGSELFGPSSGNGFDELALHDSDGNGFIDAADPVYQNLRIFSKDSQGTNRLTALGQHGIGAIYLGHASTPFELKEADGQTLGRIDSTGIFVSDEGRVGTVQEVDLAV